MDPDLVRMRKALEAFDTKLSALEKTLDEADNKVFAAFCSQIGIQSIRDYEDVQLKLAREETEAMEKFTTQKARLVTQ
jgi:structural maintenance of chromosome 1